MSPSTILPIIQPVEGEIHPDSLARLHATIVDASRDIDHLRRHADTSTAPVLEAFAEVHERHLHDLVTEMVGKGHPPEEEGTVQGLVRAGMERLNDLVASPGDRVLETLLDNEHEVIGAYNAALEAGGPPDTLELLQHQREEFGALVARHDARLAG